MRPWFFGVPIYVLGEDEVLDASDIKHLLEQVNLDEVKREAAKIFGITTEPQLHIMKQSC